MTEIYRTISLSTHNGDGTHQIYSKERTPGTYQIGSWVDPSTRVDFWIRENCVARTGLDSRTVQRVL